MTELTAPNRQHLDDAATALTAAGRHELANAVRDAWTVLFHQNHVCRACGNPGVEVRCLLHEGRLTPEGTGYCGRCDAPVVTVPAAEYTPDTERNVNGATRLAWGLWDHYTQMGRASSAACPRAAFNSRGAVLTYSDAVKLTIRPSGLERYEVTLQRAGRADVKTTVGQRRDTKSAVRHLLQAVGRQAEMESAQ